MNYLRLAPIALGCAGLWALACESTITVMPTPSGGGGNGTTSSTDASTGNTGSTGTAMGGSGGAPTKPDAGFVGTGGCDAQTPLPAPTVPDGDCMCPPVKGFVFDGECGGLELTAPYVNNNIDGLFCDPGTAFATKYMCKQWFRTTVNACIAPNVAPCIQLVHEYFSSGDLRSGTWIDGTGQTWELSEVTFGATNILDKSGTFKALATNAAGETTTLSGSFDTCSAYYSVCPI